MPTDTTDSLKDRMMVAAFRCLQEGFGFGLGTHHITPCEYDEVLTYLQTASHDVQSELSTSSSPMCLEEAYLGKQSAGRLVRLTDQHRGNTCDILESLVLAHQYILSEVCLSAFKEGEEPGVSMGTAAVEYVKTRSFCRYCVTLLALAGMQDFLRLIDAPMGSVTIGRYRSTIYSPGEIFPSKNTT
ncbi:hypothetical protein BWQ96_08077 [Gracilariopsis chorda]|uniref:Uncharacterized protein n=1 Tax=Gracilariopsis chorda TaxID=448386 RepID=A0A2V3IJH6_9FLOR|nr:hypothetical protein BWQ96_08077 [Gracilariopsis chorda]|eukprot:PXF42209.1 hypothetical protein BWQ96_08077 [Gracilariopsis chorda]